MRALRNIAVLAAAITLLTTATAAAARPAEATSSCTGGVSVTGNVSHGGCVTAAALAALPQRSIAVSFNTPAGRETHTFTGPLLLDVLNTAQPRFAAADRLQYAVLATSSTGAKAALGWGEFDPDGENKTVVLALTQDGQPLAAPRLGIPIEKTGARDLAGVCTLRLGRPLY